MGIADTDIADFDALGFAATMITQPRWRDDDKDIKFYEYDILRFEYAVSIIICPCLGLHLFAASSRA